MGKDKKKKIANKKPLHKNEEVFKGVAGKSQLASTSQQDADKLIIVKKKQNIYQKTVPAGTVLEDSNRVGISGVGTNYSIADEKSLSSVEKRGAFKKPVEGFAPSEPGIPTPDPNSITGSSELYQKDSVLSLQCPYCSSTDFVKRGTRLKKSGKIQLYFCRACRRSFTPSWTKGRQHSWQVILDALSYYNLGFSLEQTCAIMASRCRNCQPLSASPLSQGDRKATAEGTGAKRPDNVGTGTLQPSTLSSWLDKYGRLCAYKRMRPFGLRMYSPYEIIETCTLAHRQLYRFRYHRAKTKLILADDFKHAKFQPIKEFLDNVTAETPHQYFQQGERMSEVGTSRSRNCQRVERESQKGQGNAPKRPDNLGSGDKGIGNFETRDLLSTKGNVGSGTLKFSKTEMIVRAKKNYATALAGLVFRGVSDNNQRHEALQKFFLANDSVTVATEVPVYLRREDLEHMRTQLGFKLYRPAAEVARPSGASPKGTKNSTSAGGGRQKAGQPRQGDDYELLPDDEIPKLITGHIDFLQIRNGFIHILDYKGGGAAKERPIEQLTLYALALSRLTGLRVYHFKCAWFDEKDYFEFFPLHVVYKRSHSRRRIKTIEGVYNLNEQVNRIENLRPMA